MLGNTPKSYDHNLGKITMSKKVLTHHGEDLYQELEHVRNQLCRIEVLMREQPPQSAEDVVTPIAQAHTVLALQCRRKKRPDNKQLNLL